MSIEPRFPVGFVDGLGLAIGTDTEHDVDISSGVCRDDADTYQIDSSGTVTVAIDASGLNGLDTGSVANETWYSVWIIARTDTGAVGGLFSTSATEGGLTYPTNYDVARRLGWVRTDGSADIHGFLMPRDKVASNSRSRWTYYNIDVDANCEIVALGSATSWTDCNLLGGGEHRIPSTATNCLLLTQADRTTGSDTVISEVRPKNSAIQRSNKVSFALDAGNDTRTHATHLIPVDPATRIVQYWNSSSAQDISVFVVAWEDSI